MAEQESNSLTQQIQKRRAEKRFSVKLTEKCKSLLVGTENKGPGDVVELYAKRAQELCANGYAEPIGPAAWFKAPIKKPAPQPADPDPREHLDEPGNGRGFKVQVLPGKSVYVGGRRSYGGEAILYLNEEQARVLLDARRIKLIDPPGLPARLDAPKNLVSGGISRFGCSGLVGAPALARDNIKG